MLFHVPNSQCCCLYVLVCSVAFCLQQSRVDGEAPHLFLSGAPQSVVMYLCTWLFQSIKICSHCHQTAGSEIHFYLACLSDFPVLFFILMVPFSVLADHPHISRFNEMQHFFSPIGNIREYWTWDKSSLNVFWSENGNHAVVIQEAVLCT